MVLVLTPEYRNISKESCFTLLYVGVSKFSQGMDSHHYNDCKETSTKVGFPVGELVELTVVNRNN
jgi:hypothetical protein